MMESRKEYNYNSKDLYEPTSYNIGYLGEGLYRPKHNKRMYDAWRGIFRRSNDKIFQNNQTTYIGCTVDERWHNFQVFAKWYEKNYVEGWHLDKDILQKGNKIYSPETCCFVPQEVNCLLTKTNAKRGEYPIGVRVNIKGFFVARVNSRHVGTFITVEEAFQAYKTAKERCIKEVADKWKELITEECYQALNNYKVEITD